MEREESTLRKLGRSVLVVLGWVLGVRIFGPLGRFKRVGLRYGQVMVHELFACM